MKISIADIALFVCGSGIVALALAWTMTTPRATFGDSYVPTVIGTCLVAYVILKLLAASFGILKTNQD